MLSTKLVDGREFVDYIYDGRRAVAERPMLFIHRHHRAHRFVMDLLNDNVLQCFNIVGWVSGRVILRCWCGYLSGERCRLFAYSPVDATVSKTSSLASFKSRLVYLSVTGYTQTVLEKRPLNGYRPLVVAVKREKISELNFSVRKPKT